MNFVKKVPISIKSTTCIINLENRYCISHSRSENFGEGGGVGKLTP